MPKQELSDAEAAERIAKLREINRRFAKDDEASHADRVRAHREVIPDIGAMTHLPGHRARRR